MKNVEPDGNSEDKALPELTEGQALPVAGAAVKEMCIRDRDFKRYTTEEMRDEMLITGLYKADEVVAVYSLSLIHILAGSLPHRLLCRSERSLALLQRRG